MFKIVIQEKELVHRNGDNIYCTDECLHFIRNFTKKEIVELLEQKHLINLHSFCINKFKALITAGFDSDQVNSIESDSAYNDPFYNTVHYGICPIAIICDSAEPYDKRIQYDKYLLEMLHDRSWKQQDELVEKLKSGQDLLICSSLFEYFSGSYLKLHLGPGYTDMCHPSDGHAGHTVALMDIEGSTDKVLCFVREWYNK